jgi:uncharacterized protein (TIGR03083 family)
MDTTWEAIRSERASLVDALAGLPDDAWDKPSLCPGWPVRAVVAHLVATAQMTPPKFFAKLAASGFRFHTMSVKNIHGLTESHSNAELVALYRSRVGSRTAPPGPAPSWLGETIVHGEDIFRALGPCRDHPVEHVTAVAEFYAGSNLLIGTKNRIAGIRLRASDADWSHGTGPEATGPAIALVMAMTGRKAALDDLTGDGATDLRDRT